MYKTKELGSSIAIDAKGKLIAPDVTIVDANGIRYRTDSRSYAVVATGVLSVLTESGSESFSITDPRVIAFYGKLLAAFAKWASKGFDSAPEPTLDGEQLLPSADDAQQVYDRLGIPKEPSGYSDERFADLSRRLGLPDDDGVDGWYASAEKSENDNGPLIELCDGRFVRAGVMTEEDKGLVADPHDSAHNASVFGGDTFVDGKFVWQKNA